MTSGFVECHNIFDIQPNNSDTSSITHIIKHRNTFDISKDLIFITNSQIFTKPSSI